MTHAGVDAQDVTAKKARNHTECPATRDEFTAWLVGSCQRQNLPVTITDPTLLATIATLLR
ncbi:hypothetical protein MSM1_16525 [Mycobacterium sp. SM1]|nr:hypothetical protein [Mycobacterium sp. SM1]